MVYVYPVVPILLGAVAALACATIVGWLATALGFPRPATKGRIGCIDGLRGYLALFVLVHHFIIWMQVTRLGGSWSSPTLYAFANVGMGGVSLFFMTSGLVFYPRVLAGFRATSWRATWTGRVFRIIPLAAISVMLVMLVIALRTGRRPLPPDLATMAQWLTGWGTPPLMGYGDSGRLDAYVLWSLYYEWIFYLAVLPACALARDAVRGRWPSWVVPAALLVISLAGRLLDPFGLPKYMPLFAIGMLAYEAQRCDAIRRFLTARWMAVPAGICLVLGLVSAPTPYEIPQLELLGAFFAAVACGNSVGGVLRTRAALVLGECSYGIYLLHGTALSLLFVEGAAFTNRLTTGQLPALLPIVAVVVAGITPLTYLLVERPLIRLGGRIAKPRPARRAGTRPRGGDRWPIDP